MSEFHPMSLERPSKSQSKSISLLVAIIGILLSIIGALFITGFASTRQLLIIVFGLVGFIATFIRLDLGVAAMIVILYSQTYLILSDVYGILDVIQWLILLLVVSMGTRWVIYSNEIPEGWFRPLALVLFYCMVGLASVLYAVDPASAQPIAIELIKSGVIALIICIVLRDAQSFRIANWSLLITGIFLGTISIIQFTLGSYDNDYGGYALAAVQNISGGTNDYRLGGPIGDPNFYAQIMLVMVPIALDRMWNERQAIMRLLAGLALIACTFTVLLTYSRGGFVAMVIVVFAMLFIHHRGNLSYLVAVALIGLLLINLLPSRFTERMVTLTELLPDSNNGVVKDYSFRGRTSEMIVALRMFADHPILGVGLGNYPVLYQQYSQKLGLDLRSEVRQAHSLYLEIASETGLLGLFSFSLLLFGIMKSLWKSQKALASKGLFSTANMVAAFGFGFLGYLIAAIFIHSAFPRNFWVLAGIALCIPRMAELEIMNAERLRNIAVQDLWGKNSF